VAFEPSKLVGKREREGSKREERTESRREADNGGSTVREGTEGREHSSAHPGFKAVQGKIAAERGVSRERAGAILGAATRHASPAAKAANPRLRRVKG
jgi:hypothetical protein